MATQPKQSESTEAPEAGGLPPEIAAVVAEALAGGGATASKRGLIGNLPEEFGTTGIAPSPTAVESVLSSKKKGTGVQFAEAKGKAQYYDGDQTALFQGLRTADVKRLQDRLRNAGYLEGDYRYGDIMDGNTQQALTQLLFSANGAGEDYETTLTFAENSGMWYDAESGTFRKGKRPAGKLPVSLSDPVKLSDLVQQVAGNQIGRRLSDQEVAKFVQKFHGIEQANDAGNLDAPDIELYADKFAQAQDPVAYEGQSLVNVFQEAMSVIGGGIETKPAEVLQAGQLDAPGLGEA